MIVSKSAQSRRIKSFKKIIDCCIPARFWLALLLHVIQKMLS